MSRIFPYSCCYELVSIILDFSKFTLVPFFQYLELVFSSVSLDISAVNLFFCIDVAVKQIPEQQIEEPISKFFKFDSISILLNLFYLSIVLNKPKQSWSSPLVFFIFF